MLLTIEERRKFTAITVLRAWIRTGGIDQVLLWLEEAKSKEAEEDARRLESSAS